MLKRFLAPFFVISLALSVITITALNSDGLAKISEANQDYFIKPILRENLVVVEPNYGRFYNPSTSVEGDTSGEILYNSLKDVEKTTKLEELK